MTVLNLMGYNAMQLEWGTMGWSKNDAALGTAVRFPGTQQDYPVDMRPTATTVVSWSHPVIATRGSGSRRHLATRADAVEAADTAVSMSAEAVQTLLTDANPANDPFVVDTRKPEDYAKGHIKGVDQRSGNDALPAGKPRQPAAGTANRHRRLQRADHIGMSYVLSINGLQRPRAAVRDDGLEPRRRSDGAVEALSRRSEGLPDRDGALKDGA